MRNSRGYPLPEIALAAALLVFGSAASADDLILTEEPHPRRSRTIIAEIEKPRSDGWFDTHFRIKKRAGIEFHQPVAVGERDFVLGVYAPVVGKKHLGLGFEIRF